MDKRRSLSRYEALGLVRRYKQIIAPRFAVEPKVMMYGSYSKGYANPDSDIDVAVIVPTYGGRKMEISKLQYFHRLSNIKDELAERMPGPLPKYLNSGSRNMVKKQVRL